MKYKLLGSSGLRVSEICLGTMTFGDKWGYGADKEGSEAQYNTFREAGGNFIDTANRYTDGESENFLGDLIAPHRHDVVLASKYTLRSGPAGNINDGGNSRKNMMQSIEGSLKRLKTDYLDLFYLHAWDFTTSSEEVLRGMQDLISQGKVLYAAISDTPAWVVSRANTIAELRGWSKFIGLQIEYSLIQRTPERDLIPMAQAMNIGVTAWGPIAGGALSGKYLNETDSPKRLKEGSIRLNERSAAIAREVVAVAEEAGCSPVHVALNWLRQQQAQVIPIVGARNAEQLRSSLESVNHSLSPEHIARLSEVSKIELGFPHDFLQQPGVTEIVYGGKKPDFEFQLRS
ncbi:MAG: aldo/keto reductase [Bacteroidota bacterium]